MLKLVSATLAVLLLCSSVEASCPPVHRTPRALAEEPRSALENGTEWPDGDPTAADVYLQSPAACVEIEIPEPDLTNDPIYQPRPLPGTFRGTVLNSWEMPDPRAPRWP
jgi:hypothetical protein